MSRPFHLWGWMSIWSDRFFCLLFLLSDWRGANGRTHQAHQLLWPKLLHRCDNHHFQPFILECGKTLTIILWSQFCGWCSFSLQPNPILCFSLEFMWSPDPSPPFVFILNWRWRSAQHNNFARTLFLCFQSLCEMINCAVLVQTDGLNYGWWPVLFPDVNFPCFPKAHFKGYVVNWFRGHNVHANAKDPWRCEV